VFDDCIQKAQARATRRRKEQRKMGHMTCPAPAAARAVAPALAPAAALLLALAAAPAAANPASAALRHRGSTEVYNLDQDEAIATFRSAIAADPEDAAAYRGLATGLWLTITFQRGNLTVDDYLGRVSKPNVAALPTPPDIAGQFNQAIDKAAALARGALARNARDVEAHYQLGAAVGLRASYIATVEARMLGAFRTAREAYEQHQAVLSLEPQRKDAGLIVGTYRYLVSSLILPMRWMAYVVGFGGDRERGVRLIEGAAAYPGENQEDARFALVLIYNRERRYDDALKQLTVLGERYPRNRLVWLERGSTSLRAGRPADAERALSEGLARFADDRRPRMFSEEATWYYKRGAARAGLGRVPDAEADLKRSLGFEGRKWVHGRGHLELGKLAEKAGNRALARQELQAAIALCESDNDPAPAEEARRLLK
jgi:tetratricopeptide (TPR) repeat protein